MISWIFFLKKKNVVGSHYKRITDESMFFIDWRTLSQNYHQVLLLNKSSACKYNAMF